MITTQKSPITYKGWQANPLRRGPFIQRASHPILDCRTPWSKPPSIYGPRSRYCRIFGLGSPNIRGPTIIWQQHSKWAVYSVLNSHTTADLCAQFQLAYYYFMPFAVMSCHCDLQFTISPLDNQSESTVQLCGVANDRTFDKAIYICMAWFAPKWDSVVPTLSLTLT